MVGSPQPKEIKKISAFFSDKSFSVISDFKLKSNDKYEFFSSNFERFHNFVINLLQCTVT